MKYFGHMSEPSQEDKQEVIRTIAEIFVEDPYEEIDKKNDSDSITDHLKSFVPSIDKKDGGSSVFEKA